jgi:hypothetical protein
LSSDIRLIFYFGKNIHFKKRRNIMFLKYFTELTEAQLDSVAGGSYYTWKCANAGHTGDSVGGGGGSSGGPTFIHFGNSSNIGILNLSNIYIGDNSSLTINFLQNAS